jgi:O-antigen/teichoic acid export membrane protein
MNKARRWMKSPFAGAVMRLMAGTAFAQVIGILAAPVTARIFHPADVGQAAVFAGLLSLPLSVVTLRYDYAVPLPKEAGDRLNLLGLCLLLLPASAVAWGLGLWWMQGPLVRWLKAPGLDAFLWMVPPFLLVMGMGQLATNWMTRRQKYRRIMGSNLAQSGGQIGLQLSAGAWTGGHPGCLVGGQLLGQCLGLGWLLCGMKDEARAMRAAFSRARMCRLAWEYRGFPLLNSWSALLSYFTASFPLLAITNLHGMQAAGYYRYAQMLLALPIGALGTAVLGVYWSGASRLMHDSPEQLPGLRRRTTWMLVGVAALLIGYALLLPWMVPVVLGERWTPAGSMAWLSCAGTVAAFITSPTCSLMTFGYNHWHFGWDIFKSLIMLGAGGLAWWMQWGPDATVLGFSIATFVAFVVHFGLNEIATARVARSRAGLAPVS